MILTGLRVLMMPGSGFYDGWRSKKEKQGEGDRDGEGDGERDEGE